MGVSGVWPIYLIKMYHAHTSFVPIQTRGGRFTKRTPHQHDRVDQDHRRRRGGHVQRQQSAQTGRGQINADAPGRAIIDAARLGGLRTGKHDRKDQCRRRREPDHRSEEERVVADHSQHQAGQHRADDVLKIIGQS